MTTSTNSRKSPKRRNRRFSRSSTQPPYMRASAVVYFGLVIAFAGLMFVVRPIRRLGVPTRLRGLAMAGAGLAVTAIRVALPAFGSRGLPAETPLAKILPGWYVLGFPHLPG